MLLRANLSVVLERGLFALRMLVHVPVGFVGQDDVDDFDPAHGTLYFRIKLGDHWA